MLRAVMRMARNEFQDQRHADQQQRVAARQQDFNVNAEDHFSSPEKPPHAKVATDAK
jgi:hypothetical protein